LFASSILRSAMATPGEMRYFSTRGGSETLSFEEVSASSQLDQGLTVTGGLDRSGTEWRVSGSSLQDL